MLRACVKYELIIFYQMLFQLYPMMSMNEEGKGSRKSRRRRRRKNRKKIDCKRWNIPSPCAALICHEQKAESLEQLKIQNAREMNEKTQSILWRNSFHSLEIFIYFFHFLCWCKVLSWLYWLSFSFSFWNDF